MKKNAVLMVVKTLLSLIVPLVTFPYISRVLQVDSIGQYNFASSIVSYFLLFSGLGISTYAIREGTKLRGDRKSISTLASEMYLLNWISTVISFILLLFAIFYIPKLQSYIILILILSIQVLFTTFGRAWIYNIFEDFSFVTIVQMFFQIFSVVVLVLCVRTPNDINAYAIISVVSATGSNILYGYHTRKYVDFHIVRLVTLKKHLKPILMIFSTSIATTIYVNSDITILGWMADDESVGLYSVAVKISNIIKQIFTAIITISIPRLTLLSGTESFKKMFSKVFDMLFFMVLPAATGIFVLSENAISIIAGENYLPAEMSLKWLSIALIFALIACQFGMSVLLPYGKEKIFLLSTMVGATFNIVANFVLIPIFRQNAAAFTTALSQFIVFVICFKYSKGYIDMKLSYKSIVSTLLGCLSIIIACMIIKAMGYNIFIETILCIIISCILYISIGFITKNSAFSEVMSSIIKFVKNKMLQLKGKIEK